MKQQVLGLIKSRADGYSASQLAKMLKQPSGRIQILIGELLFDESIRYGTYGRYVSC